jgi:hypothetical protein
LINGGFRNVSSGVACRSASSQTLDDFDFLGRAVEVLTLDFYLGTIVSTMVDGGEQVEMYIGHAITGLALPLFTVLFLLMSTHLVNFTDEQAGRKRRKSAVAQVSECVWALEKFWELFSRSKRRGLALHLFETGTTETTLNLYSTSDQAMPPRIPVRFPWASGSINAPSYGLNAARTFSSTSPSLALGPESPNYIEVPKPVQPRFPPKSDIKGHLPVPRDVFKTRSKLPKEKFGTVDEYHDAFVARATSDPLKVKVPGPYSQDADYRLYKQRLAQTRKEALREGVKKLYERKTKTEASDLARIQQNSAERRALAMAPPRTVDVLTQTSIQKGIRDFLTDSLPQTPREAIVKARRKGYVSRVAKQNAVRRQRLHDLYTNARKFIVNEEQLDEAIEKAFGTEESPVRWDNKGSISPAASGMSPWDGPMPEGVGDKLQKLKGGEGVGLARERVRKVAEALTGGKM